MPPCHCVSSKCNGRDVDTRTLRTHSINDKALVAKAATKTASDIIDAYVEDIGTLLSGLALKDEISGDSLPGGRLWSKAPVAPTDVQTLSAILTDKPFPAAEDTHETESSHLHKPVLIKKTRRETRVDRQFLELDAIDIQIKALVREASRKIAYLRKSVTASGTIETSPLCDIRRQCHIFRHDLANVKVVDLSVKAFKDNIQEELADLEDMLEIAHQEREARPIPTAGEGVYYDTSHHFVTPLERADPIMQLILFMVVACQVILHVPRRGCSFILAMIKLTLELAFQKSGTEKLSPKQQKLMNDFPADPRTAVEQFNLDGRSTVYAVCPKCHHTYAPRYRDGDRIAIWPEICTYRKRQKGQCCKERLLRTRSSKERKISVPIKPFVYFNFDDWLSRMLARPGIETVMDDAWRCMDDPNPKAEMSDIFHGDILRNFRAPAKGNEAPLFKDGGDEGRYVFTLCVDFFNPYTMKQAGKKRSVGLISMVCLNLPPDLRYKPENMYLAGVVPGPREPLLDEINHYLRPLVSDLCDSWEPGFYFSHTFQFPTGRRVVCALIALVCDLPGARKAACLAASSHEHFCSVCHCCRNKEGYGDTDVSSWKRRTNDECRAFAEAFKDAETELKAQSFLDMSGVRWSELLRLPYFDPTRFIVVDAMHNLFLGLIKTHITQILGIDLDRKAPPEAAVLEVNLSDGWKSMTIKEQKSVRSIRRWLQGPLAEDLASEDSRRMIEKRFGRCHRRALHFFCQEFVPQQTPHTMTVKALVKMLLDWRKGQVETQEIPASTSTQLGHVLTKDEVEQIRRDIGRMIAPSWFPSVPVDFGSASHGKLKADQWRVIGTTYLPVSLVRLWAQSSDDSPRSTRCKDILDVTMFLVSATAIATSRVTSHVNATLFLQHMTAYIEGVKRLFPTFPLRPNHHMALHLPEYLVQYGPVHAWWLFPFERVIGMLQRTATNCKLGELEETISRSFTRSANLRNIMQCSGCPDAIRCCRTVFDKLINPRATGSLFHDIASFSASRQDVHDDSDIDDDDRAYEDKRATAIPSELFEAMKNLYRSPQSKGVLLPYTYVGGVLYSINSKHQGNSCALVKVLTDEMPAPCRIEHIIQCKIGNKVQTLVGVRRYLPFDRPNDPFRAYPFVQARLWSAALGVLEVYHSNSISSHFVAYPYEQDAIVAISLNRYICSTNN